MSTYREQFHDYLEECLSSYGRLNDLVTLVNMYQRSDTIARELEFQEWTQGHEFVCEVCNRPFTPNDYVDEDDPIRCEKCR